MLALAPVLAGVTAAFVTVSLPKTYRATSFLVITPVSSNIGSLQDVLAGQSLARTYAALLKSDEILSEVKSRRGLTETLENFSGRVRADPVRDTTIVALSVDDQQPDRAAQLANDIASVFIDRSRVLQTTVEASTLKDYETQIDALNAEIADLNTQLATLQLRLGTTSGRSGPPLTAEQRADIGSQIAQLESSRALRQQTMAAVMKARDEIQISAARANNFVSIWQEADVPVSPIRPILRVNVAVAAILGLLAVLGVILAYEYIDDTIRSVDGALERTRLPLLGTIRRIDIRDNRWLVLDNATSPDAEAFRSIRTSVRFAEVDAPPTRILISSAQSSEGKSFVASNLAASFAMSGLRVLLIDADLRRPSQHRAFRIPALKGLTNYLVEQGSELPVTKTSLPLLDVLPCGPLPPNPAEVIGSRRMNQLLRESRSRFGYEMVIVDSPPLMAVTDASLLAAGCDGVILVVDIGRTNGGALARSVETIGRVGGHLLGFVANKVRDTNSGSYYYYNYESGPATAGKRAGTTSPS